MSIVKVLLLAFCLGYPNQVHAVDNDSRLDYDGLYSSSYFLTRDHISRILQTALDDDGVVLQYSTLNNDRQLQEDIAWQKIIQHGWEWNKRSINHFRQGSGSSRRNLRSDKADESRRLKVEPISGFVVCSSSQGQSGYKRREAIVASLNVTKEHAQTISNTNEETCFIVTSSTEAMELYLSQIAQEANTTADQQVVVNVTLQDNGPRLKLGPLVDALKVPKGTAVGILEDSNWSPPNITNLSDLNYMVEELITDEFSYENVTKKVKRDVRKWTRSIMIELLPGSVQEGYRLEDVAKDIVEYVKIMAQISPFDATNTSSTNSTSRLRKLESTNDTSITSTSTIDNPPPHSIRQSFSLTAIVPSNGDDSDVDDSDMDDGKKPKKPGQIWSNALKKGVEAPHGCQDMLNTLEVQTRREPKSKPSKEEEDDDKTLPLMAGFEVVLHAPSQFEKEDAVQSSVWNKNCVLSLLMGFSVHPLVQTVEVSKPIVLASIGGVTNPQWITQSGEENRRPFFGAGLDGSGQVVAVADGGLDTDNCYFRDSSASSSIYGRDSSSWDFSQRKIVHYDNTFGDKRDIESGHGTSVACILAGRKSSDGSNEERGYADGTAPGSRLAFFDMENDNDGIGDPGVDRLLASLYKSGQGGTKKGARVINASWGRSYYGQYTSYCREYDSALRDEYPGLLFVVSAGNTGREGVSSIQDPASCKNPFAVGSSLSYGSDAHYGEKGIEHLADYSSRGPTHDKRMKPDIVAPGHFVLAANANPDTEGECDRNFEPDVKESMQNGSGTHYITGTSMAAPVLAGAAAILRQYFEEGYCNANVCCGYQGCTGSIDPSGSLLKAILMNGAQPLQGGVQYVPGGEMLDTSLQEYDSNQGVGRVNLLNSVPLVGENSMQMQVVNDKFIVDGAKDLYTFYIDRNKCNRDRPFSVTLTWYDPPSAVGCTNCLVNDLDLSVKTSSGVRYPNGQNYKDSKNTVERIQFTPENESKVRVIVAASNLATNGQKYSLAITGCFQREQSSDNTLAQQQFSIENMLSTRSLCPSSRLFQVEMNVGIDEQQLTWTLIKILSDDGIEELINGPTKDNVADNATSTSTSCLDTSARYRFQVRSYSGDVIQGQYQLTYGDTVIFNSELAQLGRVSTLRFETDENGIYHQSGRNSYTTHVVLSDSAEVGVEGSSSFHSPSSGLSPSEDADLSYLGDDDDEEDEGSESVGVIDYELLSMQMVDFQSLSMPMPLPLDEEAI